MCGVTVRAVVSGSVAVDPADRALPPLTDSPPLGMYMARSNSPLLGVLATGITGKAGPPGSTEVEM